MAGDQKHHTGNAAKLSFVLQMLHRCTHAGRVETGVCSVERRQHRGGGIAWVHQAANVWAYFLTDQSCGGGSYNVKVRAYRQLWGRAGIV
jgi:hypothetical protein